MSHVTAQLELLEQVKGTLQPCVHELARVWETIGTPSLIRYVFLFIIAAVQHVINISEAQTVRLVHTHEVLLGKLMCTRIYPKVIKMSHGLLDV